MSLKHTPTPWMIKDENGKFLARKSKWTADYDGNASMTSNFPIMAGKKTIALVVNVDKSWDDQQGEYNGEFIVRACNAHDDLVAALKHSRSHLEAMNFNSEGEFQHVIEEIDAALAKANEVRLSDSEKAKAGA